MLDSRALTDLTVIAQAGLAGDIEDLADLLDLLSRLELPDKQQFWAYLKAENPLLMARIKRAKQRVDANPPKPKPWYSKRLGNSANAV